jgi:hypothetical protein
VRSCTFLHVPAIEKEEGREIVRASPRDGRLKFSAAIAVERGLEFCTAAPVLQSAERSVKRTGGQPTRAQIEKRRAAFPAGL